VALAARRRRIWVNTVDTPAACDFIAPAVVRRGAVQIAISTGGKSPTLAKRLREGLEAFIGPEYGDVADILGALRAAIRGGGETPEGRKVMFERLVEASGLPLLMAAPPKDPAAVPVRIPGDVRPKAKARVLKVLTVSVKRLMQRRV
jgi:siroheme synthase-like protein